MAKYSARITKVVKMQTDSFFILRGFIDILDDLFGGHTEIWDEYARINIEQIY